MSALLGRWPQRQQRVRTALIVLVGLLNVACNEAPLSETRADPRHDEPVPASDAGARAALTAGTAALDSSGVEAAESPEKTLDLGPDTSPDPAGAPRPAEPGAPLARIAVLSDLHVHQTAGDEPITPGQRAVIAQVLGLHPDAVVLTGDLTSGSRGQRYRKATLNRWWAVVDDALGPLRAAGIPVLVIPGNHDTYSPEQVDGYARAWADVGDWARPLALARDPDGAVSGAPPFYYAVEMGSVHLTLLDVSDRELGDAQTAWLQRDLDAAARSRVRLAFGHIPLRSVIAHASANRRLEQSLGTMLTRGRVDAYFCGHEHTIWDERLQLAGGGSMRQVVSGVAGGGYVRAAQQRVRAGRCDPTSCRMPASGLLVPIDPKTARPADTETFVLLTVGADAALDVQFYAVRDGTLVAYDRTQPSAEAGQ